MIASPICSGRGGGASVKLIHISLVFLAFSSILFSTAQLCTESRALCKSLDSPNLMDVSMVQSSAYLVVLAHACSETFSSISLICMLNRVGEIADL